MLARHFVDHIAAENDRPAREIGPEAMDLLLSYSWPGNVRELRNLLEGIIVLSTRERIEVSDLPEHIRTRAEAQNVIRRGMTMEEIEKEAIRRALEETGGHRGKAAERLGLSTRTLQRKIKAYGLPF